MRQVQGGGYQTGGHHLGSSFAPGYRGQYRNPAFPSDYGKWLTVLSVRGIHTRIRLDDGREFTAKSNHIHRPELHGEMPTPEAQ